MLPAQGIPLDRATIYKYESSSEQRAPVQLLLIPLNQLWTHLPIILAKHICRAEGLRDMVGVVLHPASSKTTTFLVIW